jgi:hypothetical protein
MGLGAAEMMEPGTAETQARGKESGERGNNRGGGAEKEGGEGDNSPTLSGQGKENLTSHQNAASLPWGKS